MTSLLILLKELAVDGIVTVIAPNCMVIKLVKPINLLA